MADKKITELQLISSIAGTESIPGDDGIQTYRFTPAQMKTFVLSARHLLGTMLDSTAIAQVCQGRLTLATGNPVTTTDQTGKTTIYFTPYNGNKVALYDGTYWNLHTLTEKSIAVPSTTATMYDLFLYDNAGTLTLEALAWTNVTTRATAITQQDGVDVKTGALTRRLVGSFCTTAVSGQTEDSKAKRYLSNRYNRVRRQMHSAVETTDSWNYTTFTWRQANANAANQLNFVNCIDADSVNAIVGGAMSNTSADLLVQVGIALDATNTNHAQICPAGETLKASTKQNGYAMWNGLAGVGYHFLAWTERSSAAGTSTFYGDAGENLVRQSGIIGEVFA